MAAVSGDYQKYVLDDLKNYVGLGHPVRSGVLRRLLTKKVNIKRLHPNPDDEFSMPEIGPNNEIILSYEEQFRRSVSLDEDPFKEPLYVTKLSTGGYLILNGHHRWFAAHRVNLKKIPVRLINSTSTDSIIESIRRSEKDMCASFDLDEVLFTDGHSGPAEKSLPFPFDRIYRQRLRKNATALIRELRAIGCDVWVYTGEFYSDLYLKAFFALHRIQVDGIISGKMSNHTRSAIRAAFTEKYKMSLHIDNDGILCVNTKTKEYETVDFPKDDNAWAVEAYTTLKDIKLLKGTGHDTVSEK